MGASVSQNVTNVVVKAVAKISSEIVQKTKLSSDSSQVIYISNTGGDVIIRGNKMIQRANLNMTALFQAMSSESAQQNLALEIAQSAKSLTSGLNLGQFSDAENDMDLMVQTSIEITSKIGQECASMAQQSQQIVVVNTIGSVVIENNVFEQMTDVMGNCVESAVNNSDAMQAVVAKLKQDASATSAGLSGWILVAMLAVFMGIPTVGVVVGGKEILKYLFPFVLIAGVIMLILYFAWTKTEIAMKGYSKFISKTPGCLADPANPPIVTSYPSAEAAGDSCMKNSSCAAFDWKGIDINSQGQYTMVVPPQTQIYKSVSSDCQDDIQNDNVNMVRIPVFYSGSGVPSLVPQAIAGDCYIDVLTSIMYQLNVSWYNKGPIISKEFKKILVTSKAPAKTDPGNVGDFIIVAHPDDPSVLDTYKFTTENGWSHDDQVPGPGMFAAAPAVTNGSGFKSVAKKPWLLYGGIVGIVIGAAGTFYTFKKMADDKKAEQK